MDILNFISWIKGGRQVTTVDPAKTLLPVGLKDGRRDDGYLAGAISVEDFLELAALKGESYIVVVGNGADAVANGALLKEAYDFAATATPYGNAKSNTNRFTIIVAPGNYDMTAYNQTYGWELDAAFVNIVSLSGEPDVYISTFCVRAPYGLYKGLNGKSSFALGQILIDDNLPGLVFEDCVAMDYSFGAGVTLNGTIFKNCTAGRYSFGSAMVILVPSFYIQPPTATVQQVNITNCTFENCTAVDYSFGAGLIVSNITGSTFKNCSAMMFAFGYAGNFGTGGDVLITSSTFTDCSVSNQGGFGVNTGFGSGSVIIGSDAVFDNCFANTESFGCSYNGNTGAIIGTMRNCRANANSFAFNPVTRQGDASGTFENCKVEGQGAFGGSTATGVFTNCTAGKRYMGGNYAFGSGDPGGSLAYGTFINCISYLTYSFGGFGNANGVFTDCTAQNYSFGRYSADGVFNNCVAGDYSFGFELGSSCYGKFYHCVGGADSFANIDAISTNFLVSGSGRACFCIKNVGSYFYNGVGQTVLACVDSINQVITV